MRRRIPSISGVAKLTFFTQPDGGVTAVNFTQQPVVKALLPSGAVDATFTGNVTLTVLYGAGSLSGTATVAAVAGVATFTDLKITGAGHAVLQAAASGYTSARSGAMTVNPAATAARTVLAFGAGANDVGACGSGASLDNITGADMSVVIRFQRTSNGNNQELISKWDGSFTSGWSIGCLTSNGEGTVELTTKYSTTQARSFSDSSNLVALNTWYDLCGVWTFSTKTWKCYLKPTGTALAEISGYNPQTAGVGTRNDDASNNLSIGNLLNSSGGLPFKGNIEWAMVYTKALTTAEMLTAQIGMDRANTAMLTGIGSCVLGHRLNATGTLTDFSGNSNSCVVAGATTTTGETVDNPTVWGNAQDAADMTSYLYPLSRGKLLRATSATSLIVGMERNLDSPTNDNQAAVAFEVAGAYDSQLAISAVGKAYGVRSLSAGAKNVGILNGPSRLTSASALTTDEVLQGGAVVTSVRYNASFTELIPPTPIRTIVIWGDSMLDGFLTNPPGQYAPTAQLAAYCVGLGNGTSVISSTSNTRSLYGSCSDGTHRTAVVAAMAALGPTDLIISLGTNDWGQVGGLWSAANFGTAYAATLVALNAENPLLKIYAVTPATFDLGEGANANFGDTLPNYRTAIVNAAAGKAYVSLVPGPTNLWNGSNAAPDNIHPDNTGATTIYTNLKAILGV